MAVTAYSLGELTNKMQHIADMLVRLEPPSPIITKDDLDYLREMYRVVIHQEQIPSERDQGRIMMMWLALYLYAGTQVKERINALIGFGLKTGQFECPYCGGVAWFKLVPSPMRLNKETGCINGCYRTRI